MLKSLRRAICQFHHYRAAQMGSINQTRQAQFLDVSKSVNYLNRALVTLNISPRVSLVDEPVQTVIHGLMPSQKGEFEIRILLDEINECEASFDYVDVTFYFNLFSNF